MLDETFDKARARVRDDELFVDQCWPAIIDPENPNGGCTASIPGYPINILPATGVTAEAVLWMINAELHWLLRREAKTTRGETDGPLGHIPVAANPPAAR